MVMALGSCVKWPLVGYVIYFPAGDLEYRARMQARMQAKMQGEWACTTEVALFLLQGDSWREPPGDPAEWRVARAPSPNRLGLG